MPKYEPTPGHKLVRASVSFYASLRPGEVGEVPTEIAEAAIRAGAAVAVDKLDDRLVQLPAAAASVKRWDDPDGVARPKENLPEPTEPAKSDTKAAWYEYAVAQGADPAEAEGLTKAALVERYASK